MRKGNTVVKKLAVTAASAVLAFSASAAKLFPDDGIAQIVRVPRWQLVRLEQEGPMPEGLRASSDRTLDPIWSVESSTSVPFGVNKGDLVAFTAVTRGVAASGEAELRVKLQDKTYVGIFNDNVKGDSKWRRRRVFGVATKDYPAGTLRLHVYPGVKRQAIDVRGWTLENFGAVDPSALPALAADPQGWPAAELKLPDGPPPPGPIVLPPLSAAEKAKKRYIIVKLDDFGSGPAGAALYPKGLQVTEYLKKRGIPASLGIICKSLEWGNAKYVEWLKANARANGGLFDYWQHGWTHAMNIKWTDGKTYFAEYGIPDYDYQKANFDKAQGMFREKTGLVLDGFCAPCGLVTDETRRLLREHEEIKTWLYGDMKKPEGKFSFRRTCNLECRVGVVETAPFAAQYATQRTRDYIMLQGHPYMWSDESFAAFGRILDRLEEDGWTFVTHSTFPIDTASRE